MLGDSALLGAAGGGSGGAGEGGGSSSGDAVAAAVASGGHEGAGGGGGSNSGDEERGRMVEEGERSGGFGGNRWPRQETLALLRIRSDMDVAFRDATVKGPLWEQVSRKMAELGYHRSAKKCKEKFENVYKYHKRTKEGRGGKSDGKTYRFFDQLEALENIHQSPNPPPPPPPSLVVTTTPPTTTLPMAPPQPQATVPSTTPPMAITQGIATAPSINLTTPSYPTPTPPPPPPPITTTTTTTANPTNILFPNSTTPNPTATNLPPAPSITLPTISFPADLLSNSTSSDETLEGRRKRKRKWKDFFDKLMREVVEKQEELQKRFLEAVEKRERERTAREEAWRVQEMQRINREREILAQERSIAAAKDAAVMSFLQKIAEQQNPGQALTIVQPQPQPQPVPQSNAPQAPPPVQQQPPPVVVAASVAQHAVLPVPAAPAPLPPQQVTLPVTPPPPQPQQATSMEIVKSGNNNGENATPGSTSSRWPKVEVQALIKLRTSLDQKYQENGPKGPLWEEISSSMRRLGYNRNAKRCKEKWENINKYFKKVRESKKQRREDSKTCPYFQELDALYREKNKHETGQAAAVMPESMVAPLMVRPEQQWPPQVGAPPREVAMEDVENDPMDDEDDMERDIGDEEDEEDEGAGGSGNNGGGNYEIVASKAPATTTTTTSVGA